MLKFVADKKERLDKFLAEAAGVSRGKVQKAIKDGLVLVSGKKQIETDFQVRANDEVELPEFKEYELVPTDIDLNIVYENSDLLVIDKPAGLLVHPGAGKTEDTISHALVARYPDIVNVGEKHRPGIVHRLDEDTSGLMMIAKNQSTFDYLKNLFLEHSVTKKYLALVHGVPEKLHDTINVPLEKNFKRSKMKAGSGKEAITEYSVLSQGESKELDQVALLKVNLHTGRTHQIRAHMAHIGHPVVGDPVYGGTFKKTDEQILNRQFLHSYYLKFQLPDGSVIELTSQLPEELKNILSKVNIKYD